MAMKPNRRRPTPKSDPTHVYDPAEARGALAADTQETETTRGSRSGERETARLSRDQESRDADHFYDDDPFDQSWLGTSNLEAPPPRPGFEQRWIATRVMGMDVPSHEMRQTRQGWRPRDPSTVQNLAFPTFRDADGKGFIGYAGLVLMERPTKLHQIARARNREKIDRRTASIDTRLRSEEVPGKPIIAERKSIVTTRPVAVQEDALD